MGKPKSESETQERKPKSGKREAQSEQLRALVRKRSMGA
jgi:hypothetical protein